MLHEKQLLNIMAITYASPAQGDIKPMDFSIYMAAQEARAKASHNKLSLEANLLAGDMKRAEAGGQAITTAISTLDQMRAYGDEDEAQLGQIRQGYKEQLQSIVQQGMEGGGLHTISNELKLQSAKLQSEINKGELGDINKRYGISQQNLETIQDLYSKGDMTAYDLDFYSSNLLSIPKPSNDVIKGVTDYATAKSLQAGTLEDLTNKFVNLADTMYQEDFAKMAMYDKKYGTNTLEQAKNSLAAAAAVQYGNMNLTGINSVLFGKNTTEIVNPNAGNITPGVTDWAVGNYSDKLQMLNDNSIISTDLKSNDNATRKETVAGAEKKLESIAYAYTGLPLEKAEAITKRFMSSLTHYGVRSLNNDEGDPAELAAALQDPKRYTKFNVIGDYGPNNPYYPEAYVATARNVETDELETFVIGGASGNRWNNMIFQANKGLLNADTRLNGTVNSFNLELTDELIDNKGIKMEESVVRLSEPNVGGKQSKYQLVTKPGIVNEGGEPTWKIVADIINTETGERLDIGGASEYTTVETAVGFLKNLYSKSF